jgi:hypothetical protein
VLSLLTNMKMTRNLLLVALFFLLSGCSRYQYLFVDSHLYQDDKKEFIAENDTVMLTYSFNGDNFPITLSIHNKITIPIYIDWSRSAVVINDYQDTGLFDTDSKTSIISPGSTVVLESYPMKDQLFDLDINDPNIKVSLTAGSMKGVRYTYDETSTPFFFTNILALTIHDDLSSPAFYENSFWVSDIIKSNSGPDYITYKPMNQATIRKDTGFGTAMRWTTTLAALVILEAITGGY